LSGQRRAPLGLQTKLAISQPGDRFEREADRVADAVVSGRGAPVTTSVGESILQRQEPQTGPPTGKEPSDEEKYKEAQKKIGEALLETETGKQLKAKAEELGKDFVSSVEGKVIAGTALGGALAAIIATNSEVPVPIPEIPLDFIAPGLKAKITWEGPVRTPTNVALTLTSKGGVSVAAGYSRTEGAPGKPPEEKAGLTLTIPLGGEVAKPKAGPSEKEKHRAETSRISAEQAKFRESLKTPAQRAEDKAFWDAYWRSKMNEPFNPLARPGLGFKTPGEAAERKKEEEPLMRKEAGTARTPDAVPPVVHEVLRSPGQPLDPNMRSFMEPRFGHDFGRVRVHTDAKAAASAQAVNASAFTVGSHVFFNSGVYQPRTESGCRLLAHELAHVVQQERGLVSRHVQRASISYRQLTWADFKGSVPADPPFSALTSSGFKIPVWQPKRDITDTKEECEVEKKKSTKHSATVSVDPAVFDTVQAKMVQEKSWVLLKYKDPDKHCPTVTTECEKEIDKQAKAASKQCKQEVKLCQDAFDQGDTRYTSKVDSTEITATSREECSTKLVSDCEKALAKNQKFEVKEKCDGAVVVSATSKADCSSNKFKEDCLKYYKDWSPRLLKHEQGHFDISNVMAGKARADLKTKAATFTATATECGRTQANNAAVKKFDALKAPDELAKRGQDWIDLKNKAEKDYDDQTDHGCKKPEQATWEKDIAAGLKSYDLNKPAAPATPSTQQKQTTAPANPGGKAASADVERETRVVEAAAPGDEAQSS
jgi:hypothetical protein